MSVAAAAAVPDGNIGGSAEYVDAAPSVASSSGGAGGGEEGLVSAVGGTGSDAAVDGYAASVSE